MRIVPRTGPVLAALVAAGALAPAATPRPVAPTIVRVEMREYGYRLSRKQVPRGTIVFRVTNAGTIQHNFKLGHNRTPNVWPGRSYSLRVVLKRPGRYRYGCTLPSHDQAGMHGFLIVK